MKRLAAVLTLLMGLIPAFGHHSFSAEYDANKPVNIKGVVAKLAWVNPHAYIYVDTKDASGKTSRYAFETSSPNALLRRGWKRDSLKEGDEVTVDGYLAKDPRPLMALTRCSPTGNWRCSSWWRVEPPTARSPGSCGSPNRR